MTWGKIMLMKFSERMQETTPTTVSINVKKLMLEEPSEMKQPDDDNTIRQKHILSP